MLILRPLLKKYIGAGLVIRNHIPNHTKNTLAAVIDTKWYAAMMINILSLHRFKEVRSQSRRLWKRC